MRHRLRWLALAFVLALPSPAAAQVNGPIVISAQDAGACATANACAVFGVGETAALAIDVSGTWSGTLTFEGSVDGSTNWRTIVVTLVDTGATATTTTANGTFTVPNVGFGKVRLRAGTFASGSASVILRSGFGSARITSPTFGNATATRFFAGDGTAAAPSITFGTNTGLGLWKAAAAYIGFTDGTGSPAALAQIGGSGLYFKATGSIGWSSTADPNAATDLIISRAAAGSFSVSDGGNGKAICLPCELTELTTIAAAATTDTAIQMPANAIVLGVSVRVTVAIPTAATFTVGDSGSAARFSTAAVSVNVNSTDPGTKAGAYYNASALSIRITPNLTPGTNVGRVRVTIYYINVTPPSS